MQREVIDESTIRKALKAARLQGKRIVVRDAMQKAFALRVGPTGAISFTYQYRDSDGRQKLYTLPSEECSTPLQARAFAQTLRNRVRDGGFDPLRNRRIGREAQEVEQKAGHTISQLCDEWLSRRTDKKSLESDRVRINAHIKPRLGHFRIDELTRKDITDAMRAIGAAAPIAANRFHSLISALLSFAGNGISGVEGLHWIDEARLNPARGIAHNRETSRERNLTPDEMARFLDVLDRHQDTVPGRQVKLLMLTLSRRAEVLGAKWSEFALETEAGIWTKPAARTKLGRTVRVPVVGGALELLRQMKAEARGDDLLFPGRQRSHVKALEWFWPKLLTEAGLEDFHVHDLRHCGATVLASSGVPLFVIAKLLGHANTSRVTERYSHLTDTAAADALAALSTTYRSATSPQNPQIEAKSA